MTALGSSVSGVPGSTRMWNAGRYGGLHVGVPG
jgi:hypothetical protein